MFGAGKVAMMIGPNNIPTYLSDGGYDINYDVTTIPANEGCESVSQWVFATVLKYSRMTPAEDQEARTAAITKFFDFFYDDARYTEWVDMEGFLPATKTGGEAFSQQLTKTYGKLD